MSKIHFPFYFWEIFSYFYKNKKKPIATIYVVVTEIIIRFMRAYIVTYIQSIDTDKMETY